MKKIESKSYLSFFKRFTVTAIVSLLICLPAWAQVPVNPGNETIGEYTFNPGYFKGSVSVGDPNGCECNEEDLQGEEEEKYKCETTVKMVKAKIWASGRDTYTNSVITSDSAWTNAGLNFEYELPVHVPCKRDENGFCTGITVDNQNYDLFCTVYYSNSTDTYLKFKSQSADVSYEESTPLNFAFTPGYVSGTILLSDNKLNRAYIHAVSSSLSENYVDTRISVGSDGKFCFPVQSPAQIKLSASVVTSFGTLDLEPRNIDVVPDETTIADWNIDTGYISGTVSVRNAGSLTNGYSSAYLQKPYIYTYTNFGYNGEFSLLVPAPNENIRVRAFSIKTSTGNQYNLSDKYADVTVGETTRVDWEFEPRSSVSGNITLNGLDENVVNRYWVKVIGNSGSKERYIYGSKWYDLTYLLPGTYTFDTAIYLNNGDDYFDPPYASCKRNISVPDNTDIENNVSCDLAFINGNLDFGPSEATVVSMDDVTSSKIYAYGVSNTSTYGGLSWDKVNTDTGEYDLILSKGAWSVNHSEFEFFHGKTTNLCGDGNERYLKSTLKIQDYIRAGLNNSIQLDAGDTVVNDITYGTGAVTFVFRVRTGDTLSSPRITGYSDVYDSNGKRTMRTDVTADGSSVKTTEGTVTFISPPGEFVIKASGIFNGVNVTFGDQDVKLFDGQCVTEIIDMYPPTLKVKSPAAICRRLLNESVTVSGIASDDLGIKRITINDQPIPFTPTGNPEDQNEVSFEAAIDLDMDSNKIEIVVTDIWGKTATDTRYIFTAGIFTVDEKGEVETDFLYDGGFYEGEIGIFSLTGMEKLEPNSGLFIEEAARRATSNTASGYVIVSDQEEGARFSGQLGSGELNDWNKGAYENVKHFMMKPGDIFAMMLVPNATIQELLDDPSTTDPKKRPLFSLASSNPEYGLYFGQIADINGEGNAFVFEDIPVHGTGDYNDLIFQVKGVTVCCPTLDGLTEEGFMNPNDDWRRVGSDVGAYLKVSPPSPGTKWITITLKSPAELTVYDGGEGVVNKSECSIPEAKFEIDENGHQVVSLYQLESGDYRIMLKAKEEGGLCHLEIKGYDGSDEISSQEKPFEITEHQMFKTVFSADIFLDNGIVSFDTPRIPRSPEGKLLIYDFDGDGDIDIADIMKVASKWEAKAGDEEYDGFYDFDNDGSVRLPDIMRVVSGQ